MGHDLEDGENIEGIESFFSRPAPVVARDLVGATLLVDGVGGVVVEVEAYDQSDPASHSYSGPTARNRSMFGPPGRAYVYRSYGVHWCLNFVCEDEGRGAGVLLRAIEPVRGLRLMRERRGLPEESEKVLLCAGPGRLCQALGVDARHDGAPLAYPPFALSGLRREVAVVAGPRVGISRAQDRPWRFMLAASPYLSRAAHWCPQGTRRGARAADGARVGALD